MPRENITKENTKKAIDEQYTQIMDEAQHLLEEGKKRATEVHGLVKEYSGELAKNVQQKPLASVLIAAGIGFILSSFLKK